MKKVFVDTAALIALGDKSDKFHHKALKVRDELRKSQRVFLTTNAVLYELGGYFCHSQKRSIAIKLIETINLSKKWNCIFVDETLTKRSFARYKQMSDKNWSLVDCISMIIAKEEKIIEIFTSDHHFEQAGFNILL